MKSNLKPVWCILAILVSISACDPRKVTDEYITLDNSTWDVDSVQTFRFSIFSTDQYHNIYFNIRNDRSYEFSNLWLFVTIKTPKGESRTDTVQIVLADPAGKWLGKGFSGVYNNRPLYLQNVFFPDPGDYIVRIRHGMRPQQLKGITDIGIRVEKVN